jgi:hypothetical protein
MELYGQVVPKDAKMARLETRVALDETLRRYPK